MTKQLLPLLVHENRLNDKPLVDRIMQQARDVGRDGFMRQQQAILGRPDSRPDLANVKCPTLVLCGRQDALTPLDRSEEIAAGIANAKLVVIEHCGHLAPMERPDEVTAAMRDWLAA